MCSWPSRTRPYRDGGLYQHRSGRRKCQRNSEHSPECTAARMPSRHWTSAFHLLRLNRRNKLEAGVEIVNAVKHLTAKVAKSGAKLAKYKACLTLRSLRELGVLCG